MKKISSILLLLGCLLLFSNHSFSKDADGGLPGYFLDLGIGARALSMGRSFVAVSNDESSIYWNPAGLVNIKSSEVSATYISLFENTSYNSIGFACPAKHGLAFGAGFIQLGSDGIIRRDENNNPMGEIRDRSTAYLFSSGYSINEKASIGSSLKYVNKQFDDIDKNWAGLDISALYSPIDKLSVGINLHNIATRGTEWTDGRSYDVPIETDFGIAYKLFCDRLTIAADFDSKSSQILELHTGIEWSINKLLTFRGGYDERDITTGIGISLKSYRLDYALLNHPLGMSQRATFSYRFGEKAGKNNIRNKPGIVVKKGKEYDTAINTMKEIPMAIYHIFHDKDISVINVRIKNNLTNETKFRINYRIGLKNPSEVKEVNVPCNETVDVQIIPSFTQEDIRQIAVVPTPTTIFIDVESISRKGKPHKLSNESFPIILLPYDQFTPQIIDARGKTIDLLDTLVNWITYNDRNLGAIINKASERGANLNPPVKIVGFQSPTAFTKKPDDNRTLEQRYSDYLSQVKLIYDTLKDDYKITYINQPVAYGNSQRIKLPFETLKNKGNCIELSVLFASLLESIEMEPILVIFKEDRHAAIAWKVSGEGKARYSMLETNVFGEEFRKVVEKGDKLVKDNDLTSEFLSGNDITFDENGVYKKNSNVILFNISKIRKRLPPSPYIPQ
ncbi:MAG: PorV/PorQ family protein [Elusimicrobia bacterium]|nr:PorV/PorQ family protein [Candidatus Liberimonas magnetica]